ncbi:MAG: LamG-like jellyroll fold domain-containing protein [Verrucomicrobiales bacterium]
MQNSKKTMNASTPQGWLKKGAVACASILAAWQTQAAEPLLAFDFNEGEGFTTADSVSGVIGTLGSSVNPDTDLVISSESSPSGEATDRSITTQGAGFLIADDAATKTLAFGPNEAFTIEAWVNLTPGAAKTLEGLVTYGGSYKLGMKAGEQVFTLFGIADITNSAVYLQEGIWTHTAVAFEPGVGVTFYNGGTSTFVANTSPIPAYRDNLLVIGAERFVNSVNASIDRLRIHRGKLTQEQLDTDAANPKAPLANTVAAYNFNETELPVRSSLQPELPTMQSVDFLPTYSSPKWTNDTPTGNTGDFALAFNMDDPSIRQRVNVDLATAYPNLGENNTNYTLEAWIKLPERLINERMVIYRTAGAGPRVSLSINPNRTLHSTLYGNTDFSSNVRVPNDNRWHHIAVVMEDFARMRFYLDGVLGQTINRTATGAASSSGSPNLSIGWESDTRYYKGLLDRVRIHNTAVPVGEFDYPAVPGLPRITTNPGDIAVESGSTVTLEAAGTSDTASTMQWVFRPSRSSAAGTPVAGQTSETLTLNNVTPAQQGFYSLIIKNEIGETESYSARVMVATAPETLAAEPAWQIAPGERDYVTGYNSIAGLRDLERGMAYNPVTGHLLLVARETNTVVRRIAILDPETGEDLGALNTTGIAGGTFLLSKIAVAEDGAIYASNFGSTSGTTETAFLRVYRWENESAVPTVAYAGNPINAQYGKNLAVRGSGATTQILLETRGTFAVMLVTENGVNFTPVTIQTNGRSDEFAVGTAFGSDDTIWGKNSFEPLVQFDLNRTNAATLKRSFLDFPGEYFSNFSFSEDGQYLAGLVVTPTGPDAIEIYDVSNLDRNPILLDRASFTADNLNGVFGGNVLFAGDMLVALSSNNGIIAFELPGTNTDAPELSISRDGNNVTITWPAAAGGFALESAETVDAETWTVVLSTEVGEVRSATVPATGNARFFRLRSVEAQ